MSAALLLSLYVTVDTTRALLVFGALHSGVSLAPSALTFGSEVLKLVVAVVGVLWSTPPNQPKFILSTKSPQESYYNYLKPYARFAIPAALYGTNNVLYFTGLKITSPALLQVCVLTKLPLTAILHHFVIRRRRSEPMWISLGVLTFGLILAGSPEALWDSSQRGNISFGDLISGPVIGLTVGIVSACSSVYTELALKEDIGFWQAQTYLYLWGALFSGIAAIFSNLNAPIEASSTLASIPAFSLVVTVTAATGLVVALILRQRDNLVKLVGSSLCITTVFMLQHLFFPVTDGLDFRTTFGIGVLTLATWTYNHYKEVGDDSVRSNPREGGRDYVELSTSEDSSPLTSKDSISASHLPDTPSSSFSTTSPIMPPPSQPDMYTPTPSKLAIATGLLIVLSSLTHLSNGKLDKRVMMDLKVYFVGRGLEASRWEVPREDTTCVRRSWEPSHEEGEWREDPDLQLAKEGCPVYPLPDEGLITHLFWSGRKWRTPTFSLTTDSWLATQSSSPTSPNRLIWWYETPPPSTFISRYSPYGSLIEFRQFNESLSEGTCLDEMKEWKDLEYRREVEMPSMTRRDLIRLLLLAKFGGVFVDVDTVFLRDLSEVVRAGPGVIVEKEFVDDGLLIAGPEWGGAGQRMLETACSIPFGPAEQLKKFPGLRLKAGPAAMYSEGVMRLCEQETCGISSLPSHWILAQTTSGSSIPACTPNSSSSTIPQEFEDSYLWSAEMLSRVDEDVCWNEEEGTLIALVRKRVEEVLREKMNEEGVFINGGGDLFQTTTRGRIEEVDIPLENESVV